jgi:predicted metal-binding protein
VLQEGRIEVFDIAFAKLLELEHTAYSDNFYRKGPRAVAFACRAVGIDRCVFPTVYRLSRQARGLNPILSPAERGEVDAVFCSYSRPEASQILKLAA